MFEGLSKEEVFAIGKKTGGSTPSEPSYPFNIENTVAHSFITNAQTTYADNNDVSIVSEYAEEDVRNDLPNAYTVNNLSNGTYVLINNRKGYSYSQTIENGVATVTNLTPDSDYTLLSTKSDGTRQLFQKIVPSGSLCEYSVHKTNFRDLGGWQGDGGKIRYGLIIRGAEVDNIATRYPKEADILFNQMRIRGEIDLRNSEIDNMVSTTVSQISPSVDYHNFALKHSYGTVIKSSDSDYITFVNAIKQIMDNVINGVTTYVHCAQGADRTGTIIYIIEGILGISSVDRDIDYELTSLCGSGTRLRTNSSFMDLKNSLNNYTSGIIGWCKDAGIEVSKMNTFRAKMINGTPPLIPEEEGKTNILAQSINEDSTIYNEIGYKMQTRVGSDNTIVDLSSSHSEVASTGYISVSAGDVIEFKNIKIAANNTFEGYSSSYYNFLVFDSNFTKLYGTSQYNLNKTENNCVVEGDFIKQFTLNRVGSVDISKIAYIRFSITTTGTPSIYRVEE